MEERNIELLIFGIILLAIGIGAFLYPHYAIYGHATLYAYYGTITYPYQTFGTFTLAAGIVLIALGFLYPSPKRPPVNQNQNTDSRAR
jgi:hypothetical protein